MVIINGKEAAEAAGKNLKQYLTEQGYNLARVAEECNGEIVPKAAYENKVIGERDHLEVVSFVGGG